MTAPPAEAVVLPAEITAQEKQETDTSP
ncbi:MAG: hypothetical protein E7240_08060 [Lachnospiraceae bacterium]|nr:hypothetical protein [Lachnospiraceae bacterium]